MTIDPEPDAPISMQREAVRHLLAAAKHLKDAQDDAGFAAVWAKDAELTIHANGRQIGPIVGRGAIMEFYRANWARGAHGTGEKRETHVAENPYIQQLSAQRFQAIHSVALVAMGDDAPILVGFGEFRDVVVHEEGLWRIAVRNSRLSRRS